MKKTLFSLFILLMCVLNANATDATYQFNTSKYNNAAVNYPLVWTVAPFETSLTINKSAENDVNKSSLKLTAGSTIVVESAYPISQIKFTGSGWANLAADCGTLNSSTWTAGDGEKITKVTFTASGAVTYSKAVITYTPSDVYAPATWVRFDGSDRGNSMTTDYIPTTPTKIGLGVIVEGGDGDWRAIFSARNTYAGTGISLYKNGNQSNFGYFTGGTTGAGDGFAELTCGQRYDIKADVTTLSLSTDGGENWTDKATGNTETNETTRCLSIFGNPEWDAALKGTIYYLTIAEGENTLANYQPAVRISDGRIGYLDQVNGKFLTSLKSNKGYTYGTKDGAYYMTDFTAELVVPESTTKQVTVTSVGTPTSLAYYSDNENIATVTADGKVTGVAVGKCNVYAIAKDANGTFWSKKCAVEVTGVVKNSYNEVDYISFDGPNENYKYYFETGYLPKYNTVIDLTFKGYEKSKGSWRAIFSGRDNTSNGMSLYQNGNGTEFGYFVSGNNEDHAGTYAANTDYTVNFTKDALTVNGEVTKTKSGITAENFNPGGHTISIFSGANDWPFYGQISSFTISEKDDEGNLTVVHNYKPAVRHDGVAGLYDSVENVFIQPNNATGFAAGVNAETTCKLITLPVSQTIFKGFSGQITAQYTNLDAANYVCTYTSKNGGVTVAADGSFTADKIGIDTVTVKFVDSAAGDVWELTQAINVQPSTVVADKSEVSDLANGIILGSIRKSGDAYKAAYTMTFDSGMGFAGAQDGSNPNFNKVWGTPVADENERPWYAADYDMTNTQEAQWSYNNTVLPNSWPGNMGEVYVRRYFTTEGELPETVYMPAAHDDAPCEYYINGTLVWSRTGFEPGVNGWYEDEIVKLNDAQKGLIKTDGSMNVFAYHVHQNWGGRYADGGLYCSGTDVANSFENNETLKRLKVAVAQAETVEGFDAEILAYSKNATVCMQDASRALNLVRFELRKKLSPRHNIEIASAEPADGLECWIYNVGTGQFLSGSNDWGTHASVDYNISSWPMILRANTSGANRYAIQTNLPNGTRGANDGLGHNGYVDCGYGADFTTNAGWAWEFQAVGNGNYRIINSGNSGSNIYLGVSEDDRYQVDTDKSGADNLYNQWKVITRAQLEAFAAKATAEKPADVSYYIKQNTFSQNDFEGNSKGDANADLNASPWERNQGSIWNWKGNDANGDYVFEMWNTRDAGKVYLKQTLTGLPVGQYYVECTGFYRDGNWNAAVGGANRNLAYIYAGSEENRTLLPNILDGANKGAGYGRLHETTMIPDGCAQAPRFFKLGQYTVKTATVLVGADGTLEIGVYRDAEDVAEQDWLVLDNFRLYRVGQAVSVSDAQYATYVAADDVDFTGSNVQAYAAQKQQGYVHLEPVTTVPAGQAVVVKAENAGVYALTTTTGATLGTSNDLVASATNVEADGTQYILGKNEEAVGFYKATAGTTIAAGKGYLVVSASEAKAFLPFGDDNATGISQLEAQSSQPIYNIAGQRVQKAQKGIYIQSGKKVLK